MKGIYKVFIEAYLKKISTGNGNPIPGTCLGGNLTPVIYQN